MKRKPLTICYLADASSIHAQRWINYFAEHGHAVHLLSFSPVEKNLIPGVHLHLLKNTIPLQMRRFTYVANLIPNTLQIKNLLKKIRPDILHAHEAVNYGRFAALVKFHPFVITPWGTDIFIKSAFLLQKPITRFTLHTSDLITCDGENTKNEMIEKFGVKPKNIALIRFGVDTTKFKRLPKDESLRKKLDIASARVVISLRALARSHGVKTLIEAVPHVLKKIPKVVFIIASDPSYDPPYMEKINTLVSSLNVGNAIKFVGVLPNDELSQYLNIADVYVSTGLSDSGLSASTAEAMACELPVVLTDSGDNKKWIQDDKGGFIVPCGDPDKLARRIIKIFEHPRARETYGKVNRSVILEKNNYESEMARMEKLYYEIAN